ncbi:MAG: hypothetical protein MRY78_12285, partial [Saprospiraceae bacterium]|nr:hypothetical protein [Saprospiraceae bacterium]
MYRVITFLLMVLFGGTACTQPQIPVDNITEVPTFMESDTAYANVYRPLDGIWKGQFEIYLDTARATKDERLLYNLTKVRMDSMPLLLSNTIEVTQVYRSLSPYFQTVEITDYYPEKDESISSKGVNKVQDGEMWCVVRKPDETVIHEGSTDGPETIIWQRSEKTPQKIEYFRE